MRDLPVLVHLAVNEENWLRARFEKTEIIFVNGRADADKLTHARVCNADLQTYTRAEGEASERDGLFWILLDQISKRDPHIFNLSAPLFMLARATAYAAKVYAQGDESGIIQRACSAKDHLVVHGASAQRMRMKNERQPSRLFSWLFQNRFEATMRSRYEKISSRIHKFRCQRLDVRGQARLCARRGARVFSATCRRLRVRATFL